MPSLIAKPRCGCRLNIHDPLAKGLAGAWLFNEGAGDLAHDVVGGNDADTLPISWGPSLYGYSPVFAGLPGEFASTTRPFGVGGGSWTLAALVNHSSVTGGDQNYIRQDGGTPRAIYLIGLRSNLFSVLQFFNGTLIQAVSVSGPSAQTWYGVVGTYDLPSNTLSLYINGALQTSIAGVIDNLESGATNGYFGVDPSSLPAGELFLGTMPQALISNRAWTASEVARWYAEPFRMFRAQRRIFVSQVGISFDSASNSGYQAASSSYSWSHTCTGDNRFLAVDVSLLSAGSNVTSITYNGVPLVQIGAQSTVTSFGRVECWGLSNPSSGTNIIAITLSGSIASAGTAVSYTGVNQYIPSESFSSNQSTNVGAADATVSVTTLSDQDWIHAAIATSDSSITAGQTSRNNITGVGGSGANEDFGPQSPGSKTMSYTGVGALATWAIGAYGIRPVAAPVYFDFYAVYPTTLQQHRTELVAY